MISYLKGIIQHISTTSVILSVHDVGYTVFVSTQVLSSLKTGDELSVFTHHRVREDASDLFGFSTHDELQFFEKLISISGIGPKTALMIISSMNIAQLQSAVEAGDATALTKISGVGKKTAERIILELQGKLPAMGSGQSMGDMEIIEALEGLGYSISDARKAVQMIGPEVVGTPNRLKAALSLLA